jgi:hypothetical protein
MIIWITKKIWEYFPLIAKFTCSKLNTNQKSFCMFKVLKPWKWTILIFFKCFFSTNVHHSFWKLESILTSMIQKEKSLEPMNFFITNLSTFGSKVFLTPQNYGFWKCALKKCYSCLYDRRHECIIYMIYLCINKLKVKLLVI